MVYMYNPSDDTQPLALPCAPPDHCTSTSGLVLSASTLSTYLSTRGGTRGINDSCDFGRGQIGAVGSASSRMFLLRP